MLDCRELDVDTLRPIVDKGPTPLFATVSGAHLYGFASADSDADIRGAFVLPLDTVLGMDEDKETWEVSEIIDGLEVDWVAHDVKKFLTLMTKRNGYVLEQLYSPFVVHGGAWLDELRELGQGCIIRHLYHHYRGFYNNECKMMAKSGGTAKRCLYAYRVLLTGIHVLRTGQVLASLPELLVEMPQKGVSELITMKVEGAEKQTIDKELLQSHLLALDSLEKKLDLAFEECTLPEDVSNRPALSDYLVRARKTLGV